MHFNIFFPEVEKPAPCHSGRTKADDEGFKCGSRPVRGRRAAVRFAILSDEVAPYAWIKNRTGGEKVQWWQLER